MRTNLGTTQRAALALGGAATIALLGVSTPAQAAGHANGHGNGHDQRSTSLKDGRGHNDGWQAQADPDGDENGGVDQPGGQGGVDTSDQDGNNGSGNDSDCEDDNRGKGVPGHCKDKPDSSYPGSGGETPGSDDSDSDQPTYEEVPSTVTPAEEAGDSDQAPGTKDVEQTEGPVSTPSTEETAPAVTAGTGTSTPGATTPVVLGIERTADTADAAGRAPATLAVRSGAAAVLPNTGADAATLALLAGGLGAVAAGTVLVRRRQVADQA